MEKDEIEIAIVEVAKAVAERATKEKWPGDKDWTRELFKELGRLGESKGFSVCCSGHGEPEWLYDLVWLKREEGVIIDVPLILESEWSGRSKIIRDFEKLLLGRARHRVMVFQHATSKGLQRILASLKMEVRKFNRTQSGDRYLFVTWAAPNLTDELFVA
jgi:hypothetical protein